MVQWGNTRHRPRHGTQFVIEYPTNRNTEQFLQENEITVFWPRLYNSLPKYLRAIESVKTEKLEFKLDEFPEFIPDEPKMPNYVTATRSNSSTDHAVISSAGSRNLPKWWSRQLGHRAGLTTSIPLQVNQVSMYVHLYICIYDVIRKF